MGEVAPVAGPARRQRLSPNWRSSAVWGRPRVPATGSPGDSLVMPGYGHSLVLPSYAVSFGKGSVPDGCVVRTFRVKVMATPAKRKRAYGLLVSGGDAWAWSIDRFHARARRRPGRSPR